MTIKEAITYFKHRLNCGQCGENTTQRVAFEGAIDALEKQIPKKPSKANDHTWGTNKEVPVCPVCDYYLTPVEFIDATICETTGKSEKLKVTYCDHCGQAIDWSDEK